MLPDSYLDEDKEEYGGTRFVSISFSNITLLEPSLSDILCFFLLYRRSIRGG